jgi:hypothetical protein
VTAALSIEVFAVPFAFYHEVRHISGMRLWAFRIVYSVMSIRRIEMASGSCECGCFAFVGRVEMNSVLTRRKVLKIEIDLDAFSAGAVRKTRCSDILTHSVFQCDGDGFIGGKQSSAEHADRN